MHRNQRPGLRSSSTSSHQILLTGLRTHDLHFALLGWEEQHSVGAEMPPERVLEVALLPVVEYPTTERAVASFQEIFADTAVHIVPCELSLVQVLGSKSLYQPGEP